MVSLQPRARPVRILAVVIAGWLSFGYQACFSADAAGSLAVRGVAESYTALHGPAHRHAQDPGCSGEGCVAADLLQFAGEYRQPSDDLDGPPTAGPPGPFVAFGHDDVQIADSAHDFFRQPANGPPARVRYCSFLN